MVSVMFNKPGNDYLKAGHSRDRDDDVREMTEAQRTDCEAFPYPGIAERNRKPLGPLPL